MDKATSVPLICPFNFLENSSFKSFNFLVKSILINSKGFSEVNFFAKSSPSKITFSQSPYFSKPDTCAHVPLPEDNNAINSIVKEKRD